MECQINILEIMQKRLMQLIKSLKREREWNVLIVDSLSERILNAACSKYEILEENVTSIENIEKKRSRYPKNEAIYFLTPCEPTVRRLIDDFAPPEPMYKKAHVYFTRGIDDDLFQTLSKGISKEYISCLMELYVDFSVIEPAVFTVDAPSSFRAFFGTSHRDSETLLKGIAQKLLCVSATLGEDPIIRYQRLEVQKKTHCHQLAMYLQRNINQFCKTNPNFPPPSNPPQPRATFLIVDRSIDPAAPLLHEFTYQAMINDLIPVETSDNGTGIKYTYEYDGDKGLENVTAILDEKDEIYTSIKHMHIADCNTTLAREFNEFMEKNNQSRGPQKSTAQNLKAMKAMMANMPQFTEQKKKYSANIALASECMSCFERQKLSSIGNLEQNMVTGRTANGETPKTNVLDMVPLLDDPYVSQTDKARLLMLYIVSKEGGGLKDKDKSKLYNHTKLNDELRSAVNNMELLGVKVTHEEQRLREEKSKPLWALLRRKATIKEEEPAYEISRYKPALKSIIEAHVKNELDATEFCFVNDADKHENDTNSGRSGESVSSMRTTKAQFRTEAKKALGAKLVVFVLGGLTFSEMRSAYEVAAKYNRPIVIGTTHLLRPKMFVEEMAKLHDKLDVDGPTIPPYQPQPKHSNGSSHLTPWHPTLSPSKSQSSLGNHSNHSNASLDSKQDKKKKSGWRKFMG